MHGLHPWIHLWGIAPQVSLIFGNISEEDILLRKELDALVAAHGDRLKV